MTSSREMFADLREAEIKKLLKEKDSVNTKMSTKVSKAIFEGYLREKKLNHPENSEKLASVLVYKACIYSESDMNRKK